MYEDQGLDPLTDGKAWQWGAAIVLTLPLMLLALPIAVVGRLSLGVQR